MHFYLSVRLFLLLFAVATPGQQPPAPPDAASATRDEITYLQKRLGKGDDAAILYQLASDYANLGDLNRALDALEKCVSREEGFDPAGDPGFAALRNDTRFKALAARVRVAKTHSAVPAFEVAQKDLVPEGLAVDRSSGTFYLGSLNHRKIVRITPQGEVSDLISDGQYGALPVLGLKVDPRDHSIWANTSSAGMWKTTLLHVSAGGSLLGQYSAPDTGGTFFNDLVIRSDGDIFITDSYGGRVFRFDHADRRIKLVAMPEKLIAPNGIALSDDDSVLYIAHSLGITALQLSTGRAVDMRRPAGVTLAGIDGLYYYRDSLLGIQNSIGSPRVVRFALSPDRLGVRSMTVLERGTAATELPTTGAILGSTFYFMSNTQVDNFRRGKVLDASKLRPVIISKIELR